MTTAAAIKISSPAERRVQLLNAGYVPIPVSGKKPPMEEWQLKTDTNPGEIALWSQLFPGAPSTGLLTRNMPTLDADIRDEEAAVAVEALVRERYEERGCVLVRIGEAPKRAFPFRADIPFKKITASLVAPNGSTADRLEFLGDGQQVVAFGIHKTTRQPYRWHGGQPGRIKHEELPYISEAEARQLVEDVIELLVRDFGYQRGPQRPHKSNGADPASGGATDWKYLTANIVSGHELHDNLRDLAAKLVTAGMSGGAAGFLRGLMQNSTAPRDERWQERYDDIPRTVASAEGNKSTPAPAAITQPPKLLIKSSKEFVAGFVPPEYVLVGILQRRFFYSLTGQTGSGKTALMLLLAACAALGRTFAGRKTKPVRVLYLAAENADDVRMRWIAFAQNMDFDINTIEVFFVEGRFSLSQSLQLLRAEAQRQGGEFGLVVVDTGPTFFEGKEENENKQQGDHARMLRGLIDTIPGQPCVVANCHPTKNAAPDQLIPRGGGAFLNETDGNMTAAKTDSTVELHHQGKFRGPDFAPMYFLIRTVTHEMLKDKEDQLIPTVIAEYISDQAKEEIEATATLNENAVLNHINSNPKASLAEIAAAMDWKLYNGDPNKMKAGRHIKELIKAKLIKKTRAGNITT